MRHSKNNRIVDYAAAYLQSVSVITKSTFISAMLDKYTDPGNPFTMENSFWKA
jgi:hypothetical protein